jgi:hypothetical protein
MEPDWMKQIQSKTVCDFFYVFYVIYAALFVLSAFTTVGVFFYAKKLGPAGIAIAIQSLVGTALAATFALFYYIICDRALLGRAAEAFVDAAKRR